MAISTKLVVANFGIFFTVLVTVFTLTSANNDKKVKVIPLDVKPGQGKFENGVDGVTCKFSYVAYGGTNEEWAMGMAEDESGQHFSCGIERPSGASYLMWQSFKLEIIGADIVSAEAMGNSGKALKKEEFKVDTKGNSVSQVDGKFKNQLTSVKAVAVIPKREL